MNTNVKSSTPIFKDSFVVHINEWSKAQAWGNQRRGEALLRAR
jgi:hypothetical protein